MKGHKDLRLVAALAPLCAVLALLIPFEALSLIFATPLALLLPGYAITAATFAKRELPGPQLFLFSVALSLATLILGSLVLNYLGGIHPLSWAILLVLVVLVGCWVTAQRRSGAARGPIGPRPRLSGLELALLLGALCATVAAIALANSPRPAERAIGFTQLWVLPRAGSGETEAQVGVRSQQQAPTRYDARIRLGDKRVIRRSFRLDPGETQLINVHAPAGAVGRLAVIVTLLRHSDPFSVYRRVKGSLLAPAQPR